MPYTSSSRKQGFYLFILLFTLHIYKIFLKGTAPTTCCSVSKICHQPGTEGAVYKLCDLNSKSHCRLWFRFRCCTTMALILWKSMVSQTPTPGALYIFLVLRICQSFEIAISSTGVAVRKPSTRCAVLREWRTSSELSCICGRLCILFHVLFTLLTFNAVWLYTRRWCISQSLSVHWYRIIALLPAEIYFSRTQLCPYSSFNVPRTRVLSRLYQIKVETIVCGNEKTLASAEVVFAKSYLVNLSSTGNCGIKPNKRFGTHIQCFGVCTEIYISMGRHRGELSMPGKYFPIFPEILFKRFYKSLGGSVKGEEV